MKRPGIFSGIALACGLGLLVLGAEEPLYYSFSSTAFLRGTLIISQIIYCLYLLRSIRPQIGTLTLVLLQVGMGIGLFILPLSDGWFLIAWALCLSLSRILLLRRGLVTSGLDVLQALAGVLFLVYLLDRSGSLAQAVWGFFLLQAASGLLPRRIESSAPAETPPTDPFQASLRQARSALEQLQKKPSWP